MGYVATHQGYGVALPEERGGQGSGLIGGGRAQGSGLRAQGSGFRAQGSGLIGGGSSGLRAHRAGQGSGLRAHRGGPHTINRITIIIKIREKNIFPSDMAQGNTLPRAPNLTQTEPKLNLT